jgi:hypothetical protein
MSIHDRYASAVHSGNLKPQKDSMAGAEPVRTASKLDVVGAYGLMSKRHRLAGALCRLLLGGDNQAAREVVQELAAMVEYRAYMDGIQIVRVQAEDLGRKVLAWYRNGTCQHCGGLGFEKIQGIPALSGNACKHCDPRHPGKVPFAADFSMEHLSLAWFALGKIEREIALAGPAAMAALAPKLEP